MTDGVVDAVGSYVLLRPAICAAVAGDPALPPFDVKIVPKPLLPVFLAVTRQTPLAAVSPTLLLFECVEVVSHIVETMRFSENFPAILEKASHSPEYPGGSPHGKINHGAKTTGGP